MNWKKLGKALLFPHIAVMLLLVPAATAFLVWSMVFVGTESVVAIVSYVLSAYTLTVWCLKMPYLIRFFKSFKAENKYAIRWHEDDRLRVNVSLYGSLVWNTAYAVFQLWLGFYHHTFWFYSLAAYYISLAVMRFFLVRYTSGNRAGEKMRVTPSIPSLTRASRSSWPPIAPRRTSIPWRSVSAPALSRVCWQTSIHPIWSCVSPSSARRPNI